MKYELNKAYSFPILGYHLNDDESVLYFDVSINDQSFPVVGYTEQLSPKEPVSLICRIVLNEKKEATLVQDEDYLYSTIYSEEHKYLFEVIGINEKFPMVYTLLDKFGISHRYCETNLELQLANNEIISRYVRLVTDENNHVNLEIYNKVEEADIIEELNDGIGLDEVQVSDNEESISLETEITETVVPFIGSEKEESPTNMIDEINRSISTSVELPEEIDFKKAYEAQSGSDIELYLTKNCRGRFMPKVQEEIVQYIENDITTADDYWKVVDILLDYDAHLFLATLAKANKSKIQHLRQIDLIIKSKVIESIIYR